MRVVRDKIVLLGSALLGLYFILLYYLKHVSIAKNLFSNGLQYIFPAIIIIGFISLPGIFNYKYASIESTCVKPSRDSRMMVIILIACALIPRILAILFLPIEQTSDYANYYVQASEWNKNGSLTLSPYNVAIIPNALPVLFFYKIVISIFGDQAIFVLQLCNALLNTGCVCLLFFISKLFMRNMLAFCAAVVYALLPDIILFTLLLATEPFANLLLLLGLYFILRAIRLQLHMSVKCMLSVTGGVCLALSNVIRPNAVVVLISFLIFVILFCINKYFVSNVLPIVLTLMVGFGAFQSAYGIIRQKVFVTPSAINYGWTLYEGMDLYSGGGWTAENSQKLGDVMASYPADQVQGKMLELAIERVKDYSVSDWLHMFKLKGISIWTSCDYSYVLLDCLNTELPGAATKAESLKRWLPGLCEAQHELLLLFYAALLIKYSWQNRRKSIDGFILFSYLPLLGMVIAHSFVTSIPRYQYLMIPFVCFSVFYILNSLSNSFQLLKEQKEN